MIFDNRLLFRQIQNYAFLRGDIVNCWNFSSLYPPHLSLLIQNRQVLIIRLLTFWCGCPDLYILETYFSVKFCVVMFGLINVNILYYSFSTLYQMCNLRQSLWFYKTNHTSAAYCPGRIDDWTSNNTRWDRVGEIFDPLPYE